MSQPPHEPTPKSAAAAPQPAGRDALLQRHRWLTFLLPLVLFMLITSLEPTSEKPGGAAIGLNIPYDYYPLVYTAKIILTTAAVLFVLPGYRQFPFRLSLLGAVVGVVGAVVWIGLCSLRLEQEVLVPLLKPIGLDGMIAAGTRSAYNPLKVLAARPVLAWGFLAVRFFGLVAVVAVIEEFFLRGFIMRLAVEADWWKVPFGKVNAAAVVLGTLIPVLMHPAELLAAVVWFSMITWLMVKTRNIWDCVLAHAVTNLLLGIYVVLWDAWHLV
ncbi:MAG TPA: CAAX prenyl protease-related protein [Thermoguttaceae bacterium]|nr:CAAX prenyl protease-related protein [Thermoguttaceae bacterium]